MGSRSEIVLNSRFPVIKKIDIEGLKELASLMGSEERDLFGKAYGNLLRLLQLEVQESAIMALSRFYDPSIRCFLFKDFQLSPTLEEYEQILGFSRSESAPYQYQKHLYSDQRLSLLLQVSVKELGLRKEKKNRIQGFPLSYFEGLLKSYAQNKKWGPFRLLLALSIFGIVLFPQVEKFIDETAIGLFLAFISKEKLINPVPAILADTYYSFTHHRVLGKKKVACSLHVLYTWFLNHVVTCKTKATDLVGYALNCETGVRSAQEWIHTLEDLSSLKVHWFNHSCWKDRPSILFRCGNFQNVPLMGTQGYINYNPSLTIRQLGYPMKNAPTEDMLAPIFLDREDSKGQSLVQKISKAWEFVVYQDKEEIAKKVGDVTFYQWLRQRIQHADPSRQNSLPEVPEPQIPSLEELNEIKSALSKIEEEKKALQDELGKVASEKRKLENENGRKTEALQENSKRLKKEEERNQELKKYLEGAKNELKRSNAKVGEAMVRENQWRKLFKESVQSGKAAEKSLEEFKRESHSAMFELENQIRCIREDRGAIENVLREYQQALKMEQENSDELKRNLRHISEAYRQVREESQYWEHRFLQLLGRIEEQEIIVELRAEIQHWKTKFSKLAWLANQAVKDVPKKLRKAEAEMLPYNTPVQVQEFMGYCKYMTEELIEKAREAAEASKERKNQEKMKAVDF